MKPEKVSSLFLAGLLLLGAVLRLWVSLHDDGIYHADEIYQSLEPAHRLVFGYGLQAWEFVEGARNWAFPGFVALLLKLSSLVGFDDPRNYLLVVRLIFSVISLAAAFASYKLACARGASPWASACGASLYGVAAPAIFFATRAIPEAASALLVTTAFALLLSPNPSRQRGVLGSSLLGLATLFRLQNGLFCLFLLLILAARRRWRELTESLILLLCWAFLFGLVDKLTWGHWFQSAIVYLQFNLVQGKASGFGTEPFTYYGQTLWSSLGFAGLLLIPFLSFSFSRARGLLLTTLAFLILHSLIPHKEMRFILPVFPLLGALAGIGLDVMARRLGRHAAVICAMIFFGSSIVSGARYRYVMVDSPAADKELFSFNNNTYDRSGSANRLLRIAYRQPDLCGLEIKGLNLYWIGGYSTLHRKVPLYSWSRHDSKPHFFNYGIVPLEEGTLGKVIATDGHFALIRFFLGECLPDEGYNFRLPQ